MGNRLVVSTAIYTDSIYANELLSINLSFGSHASNNVLRVARVFMAMNRCTERLRALYSILEQALPRPPRRRSCGRILPRIPPCPPIGLKNSSSFLKADRSQGTPINRAVIDEDNKRHATYLARMRTEDGTSTTVLVKFSVKYNTYAHKILAKHDPPLAPALYYCTPVIGGMYMVVMEYVPAKSLHNAPLPLPTSALKAINRDVSKALELLHEQELVYGDLRKEMCCIRQGVTVGPYLLILMVLVVMEKTGTLPVLILMRGLV